MPRYLVTLADGTFGLYELEDLVAYLRDGHIKVREVPMVADVDGVRWVSLPAAIASGRDHIVQGNDRRFYGPFPPNKLGELAASGRVSPTAVAAPRELLGWRPLESVTRRTPEAASSQPSTLPNTARQERERLIVKNRFPENTRLIHQDGRVAWIFSKRTELGIVFEIAIYMDPDEQGYVAQLVSPEIEDAWRHPHIAHIFRDGVICLGTCKINGVSTMRATPDMETAFAKACLWAEGIAVMLKSKEHGSPTEFPFSNNNDPGEVL